MSLSEPHDGPIDIPVVDCHPEILRELCPVRYRLRDVPHRHCVNVQVDSSILVQQEGPNDVTYLLKVIRAILKVPLLAVPKLNNRKTFQLLFKITNLSDG